jgi:FMN phosphatase YigB (HAD superfamily)
MTIVFDMGNILADETGSSLRPGIIELLSLLQKEKHTLILCTNSPRMRAREILHKLKLEDFFSRIICREQYDPDNKGVRKGIRKVNGDILIDDDPEEISYMKKIGKKGILISPYRKNGKADPAELKAVYAQITSGNRSLRQ